MSYDTPPYYISAYSLACKRGFVGSVDDWLKSLKGDKGDTGKSAYQYAVEAGYQGTEEQFSERQGQTGKSAYEFAVEGGYQGTREEFSRKLAQELLEVSVGSSKPEHKPVIWLNNAGKDAVISEEYLKTETVLLYIDGAGNKYAVYPVTRMDLVEGLAEELRTMKTQCEDKLPKDGGTMTGAIAMGGSKVTGLGSPTDTDDAASKGYVDGRKKAVAVTLAADGWSQKEQRISVSGVTAGNTVIAAPDPESYTTYCEAGIRCIGQESGTLVFSCEDVPAEALTVNLVILE